MVISFSDYHRGRQPSQPASQIRTRVYRMDYSYHPKGISFAWVVDYFDSRNVACQVLANSGLGGWIRADKEFETEEAARAFAATLQ